MVCFNIKKYRISSIKGRPKKRPRKKTHLSGKITNERRPRMTDASFIRGSPTKIINNFEKKLHKELTR